MNNNFCGNCGRKLEDDNEFCPKCGKPRLTETIKETGENKSSSSGTKICKYCKSEINKGAQVCPKCHKNLNPLNNPLWLIPIIILIVIYLYFILSPNAPLKFREIVCTYGIRSDKRYCSYFVWEK